MLTAGDFMRGEGDAGGVTDTDDSALSDFDDAMRLLCLALSSSYSARNSSDLAVTAERSFSIRVSFSSRVLSLESLSWMVLRASSSADLLLDSSVSKSVFLERMLFNLASFPEFDATASASAASASLS